MIRLDVVHLSQSRIIESLFLFGIWDKFALYHKPKSAMARFRAYASDSDSSSDEEELQRAGTSNASGRLPDQQGRDEQHESESDEESLSNSGESSGSSSSSSDMDEDELIAPRTLKSLNSRGHNALVEDRDGEIRYAHEVDVRVSPPSARSSPPSNPRQHVNGNPTIIPWAQQIGVDAQKMHVMQTSLFRMPEAAALRALDQLTRPQQTTRQNLVLPAQSLNRKHSRDSDGDGLRFDSQEVCRCLHFLYALRYKPSMCSHYSGPHSLTISNHLYTAHHENTLASKYTPLSRMAKKAFTSMQVLLWVALSASVGGLVEHFYI